MGERSLPPRSRPAPGVYLVVCLSACETAGVSSSSATPAVRAAGPVQMMYAVSREQNMEQQIKAAFDWSTGYTFSGDKRLAGAGQ